MRKSLKTGTNGYGRSMMVGLLGCLLFLAILFAMAILSDAEKRIISNCAWAAKGGLLVCAILCGVAAGAGAQRDRFLRTLTGEGALLLTLICVAVWKGELRFASFLTDIGFLVFGAFAGSLRKGRTAGKRRG